MPALLLDPEQGAIRDANLAALHFYERDEQSLRGCTLQMLSETPDALKLLHTMRQLSERGELVQPVAIKQPKSSGEDRFVHLHSSPFVTRAGEQLMLVLVQDVTARVHTQLRLDAHEERWRAVFAHSLDLTLAYDQDTTLSFVSPSALRMLGYKPEAMLGKALLPLIHPEDQPNVRAMLQEVQASPDDIFVCDYRVKHADGRWRWLSSHASNELKNPAIKAIISNCRDITLEHDALETLQRKERQLVESQRMAQVGSWEWDLATGRVSCSVELVHLFGIEHLDMAQLTADDLYNVIHPEDRALVTQVEGEALKAQRPYESVFRVKSSGDTYRILRCHGQILTDERGETIGVLGTALDITAQKRVEEELARYAKHLEASNRELEEFAYIASHDLQEPLRKIRAFGDRLQQRHADALNETGRDYIMRMQSASSRMSALIESLLDYSRVKAEPRPSQRICLDDLCHEVLGDLEISLDESGGEVQVDELPDVMGDPVQLRQLFQNLLNNAIKFRAPGRPPRITLTARALPLAPRLSAEDAPQLPMVELKVSDNGIGFEQKYADSIFAPFQRLHGRTSDYKGTGIGLAICRKIVEHHHGKIQVTSTPDVGTTFTFTLPLASLSCDEAIA